jgi:hypothetical protein
MVNKDKDLSDRLSDLRIDGIGCLREMKIHLNNLKEDAFDNCFDMYKSLEREYHLVSKEFFPARIEEKYMGIIIEREKVFG